VHEGFKACPSEGETNDAVEEAKRKTIKKKLSYEKNSDVFIAVVCPYALQKRTSLYARQKALQFCHR
jgi:predicted porin